MKTAISMYKELMKKELSTEDLKRLFTELDNPIALKMGEDGFNTEQIKNVIRQQSFAVHNLPIEEVEHYLERQVPQNLLGQGNNLLPANEVYQKIKEEFASRFEEFFFSHDLSITCQLLDAGYPLKDVIEAQKKCEGFLTQIKDPKLVRSYTDKVLGQLNEERMLRAGNVYELAEKAYITRAAAAMNKYSSYAKSNFNAFREGGIVLSLLVQDHFSPKVLTAVLRNKSFYPYADESYIQKVIDKCTAVQQMYHNLKNEITVDGLQTEADAYHFFAREYMQHNPIQILTGKDDQHIVRRMYAENLPPAFIAKALEASPVAAELGRNPKRYVSTIITVVESNYQDKKAFAIKQFSMTASMYEEKIERLDKVLMDKGYSLGVNKNRSYYDGIVAHELLEEHQVCSNILRVIAEKSPLAVAINPKNPDKIPMGYAKWIVNSAANVLKAEQELVSSKVPEIPKGMDYHGLMNAGFTTFDLFKSALKERIQDYPSTAGMLTASFIDKDVVEKLIHRYPDMDREDIVEVIQQKSPRALMCGITKNYPTLVVEEVTHRLAEALEKQNHLQDVKKAYNLQRGLVAEGVDIHNEDCMTAFYDGHAATRMLLGGQSPLDIRTAILLASTSETASVEYADHIVQSAENVVERLNKIRDYEPNDHETEQTAAEVYKTRLHGMCLQNNLVQTRMDLAILQEMLLENEFDIDEIKQAIQENSPVAVESGRDEKYTDYLEQKASARIQAEKQKLEFYKAIPRDTMLDVQKEYEHHVEELKKVIDLPYMPKMDSLIADTMLLQGFAAKLIAKTLDAASPCAALNPGYGGGILKSIEKNIQKDQNIQENGFARTLLKTTITTTTTTTTTPIT
jgi:hypothetical protein